jgi:hypothetical protein
MHGVQTKVPTMKPQHTLRAHLVVLRTLLVLQLIGALSGLAAYYVWGSPAYWVQSGYDYRLSDSVKERKVEAFKTWAAEGGKYDGSFFANFKPADVAATGPWWEAWMPILSLVLTALILRKVKQQLRAEALQDTAVPSGSFSWALFRGKRLLAAAGLILIIVSWAVVQNNMVKSPPLHSGHSTSRDDIKQMRWAYAMPNDAWWSFPGLGSSRWRDVANWPAPRLVENARYADAAASGSAIYYSMYVTPQILNCIYSFVNFGISAPLLSFYLLLIGLDTRALVSRELRRRIQAYKALSTEPVHCQIKKAVLDDHLQQYAGALGGVLRFWFNVWAVICSFAVMTSAQPATLFLEETDCKIWIAVVVVAVSAAVIIAWSILRPYHTHLWLPISAACAAVREQIVRGQALECENLEAALEAHAKSSVAKMFPQRLRTWAGRGALIFFPLLLRVIPFGWAGAGH